MASAVQNEYEPDVVSPPGETLLETLENLGMTQTELAERTGRPLKTVNEIIKGKAAITPETALQLERVLGIPARFWNSRERHYRENLARREEDDRLNRQTEWLDDVPVKELVKLGWIRKCPTVAEQAREVLNFYGVATPETWKELCQGTYYRKEGAVKENPAALVAWLRRGEQEARQIDCRPYDGKRFRALLPRLRESTTIAGPIILVQELQKVCAECGVAVVFISEIPGTRGTRLSGAARWLGPDKGLIQLSLRPGINERIWFTFFHEAGHLLLHGRRGLFVDDQVGEGDDSREAEASNFARNLLTSPLDVQHR
jgi:addiction module HigA family antidote